VARWQTDLKIIFNEKDFLVIISNAVALQLREG
jgi:hypothetical protein